MSSIGSAVAQPVAAAYDAAVARRALDLQKQQGAQALRLIDAAGAVSQAPAPPLPEGATISIRV